MNDEQIVWVVYEEDREWGATIIGVYTDKDVAQEVRNESNKYYVDSVILNAKYN